MMMSTGTEGIGLVIKTSHTTNLPMTGEVIGMGTETGKTVHEIMITVMKGRAETGEISRRAAGPATLTRAGIAPATTNGTGAIRVAAMKTKEATKGAATATGVAVARIEAEMKGIGIRATRTTTP